MKISTLHTYICTYIHTYLHTYVHTYTHTYTHTYIHIKGIKQCPINREDFNSTPDPFHRRRLRSFKVKCPNSERGCLWQGDLGDAQGHTSTCISKEVKCPKGCNSQLQQKHLPYHLRKSCPLRDYQCPHCQLLGSYESITTSHLTFVGTFPSTAQVAVIAYLERI